MNRELERLFHREKEEGKKSEQTNRHGSGVATSSISAGADREAETEEGEDARSCPSRPVLIDSLYADKYQRVE